MTGSKDIKPSDSSGAEVNTINLKVLEAQIKASGDESPETKEMLACMHKFDKNKNGTMEVMELMAMVQDNVEVTRSKTRLTVWLKVAGVMIFVLTLIMSGLVVGVVAAFKDSYVKGDSTMSDVNGHVLKVTSAKISLPLFVAPVMDGPRLAAIEKVSVKTAGFANEAETELFLKVETVRRYNDTALVFLMANDQALFVWNGETVYKDANGTLYPVCEATATCAALYVDDNDEKEQLEEKANAALEAGGFTEAAARRRLWHVGGCDGTGYVHRLFDSVVDHHALKRAQRIGCTVEFLALERCTYLDGDADDWDDWDDFVGRGR